jgi:hypothetical protein
MEEQVSEPRWWQWPTILSLDAPAVALLWQWLLARSANATLHAHDAFILGASVWLAYVADRWIEGCRLAEVFTLRHRFYQRWRWPVAAVWLAVLGCDVGIALLHLTSRELEAGLVLLAFVVVYLFSHQLVHRNHGWRLPKEACVAILLGGGAGLFPFLRSPFPWWPLIPPLTLFVLLCFVNCVLISAWECEVDEMHGQTSIALQFRRGVAFSNAAPWVLAGVAVAFLAAGTADQARPAVLCAAASSVSLGMVNLLEPHSGRQLARVLADVALMTPVVTLMGTLLR